MFQTDYTPTTIIPPCNPAPRARYIVRSKSSNRQPDLEKASQKRMNTQEMTKTPDKSSEKNTQRKKTGNEKAITQHRNHFH